MAPIKFEEQLKDKLEKRSLSPSRESWSKLANRLDEENQKSKKSIYWWLSIAAGLVILVAVSIQFFNNDNSESVIPIIVEEQQDNNKIVVPKKEIDKIEVTALGKDKAIIDNKKEHKPSSDNNQINDYKKIAERQGAGKSELAEVKKPFKVKNVYNTSEKVNDEMQSISNDAIIKETVASALQDLKSENTSVTDREIDSLLKIASKELFEDKLQKETTKTVDAEALLRSVEDAMGQSFRTKVFEALKTSYETVKTRVADRKN